MADTPLFYAIHAKVQKIYVIQVEVMQLSTRFRPKHHGTPGFHFWAIERHVWCARRRGNSQILADMHYSSTIVVLRICMHGASCKLRCQFLLQTCHAMIQHDI